MEGFSPKASIGGIEADYVDYLDNGTISASWAYGIPSLGFVTTNHNPDVNSEVKLWYESDTNDTIHNAEMPANVNFYRMAAATIADTNFSCSFAGGCNLTIQAEGLSTILKHDPSKIYISVCDERCEFKQDLSNSEIAVCKVPKMSTIFSNEQFKIETEKDDLRFRKVFGTLDDV